MVRVTLSTSSLLCPLLWHCCLTRWSSSQHWAHIWVCMCWSLLAALSWFSCHSTMRYSFVGIPSPFPRAIRSFVHAGVYELASKLLLWPAGISSPNGQHQCRVTQWPTPTRGQYESFTLFWRELLIWTKKKVCFFQHGTGGIYGILKGYTDTVFPTDCL